MSICLSLLTIAFNCSHLSADLHLVPYRTTHHLAHFSTLLDLCIIDDPDKLIRYEQHSMPFLSAHDLIYFEYNIRTEKMQKRMITFRDFRNLDEIAFRDLQSIDWTNLMSSTSLTEKITIFNQNVLHCVNRQAPLRCSNFRSFSAPWLTGD